MKKIYILFFIFISTVFSLADNLNSSLIELDELKEKKIITLEEYNILKSELIDKEDKKIYDLSINSKLVTREYRVIKRNGKDYLPLKEFFEYINFKNYELENKKLIAHLGTSLKEVKIDLKEYGFFEENEIYIEKNKFKEAFLSDYEEDEKKLKIRMYLSFDTPKEILQLVDINKYNLLKKENENELIFTSKRKLFDLGYTKIYLGKTFDKASGSKSYKNSWDGSFSYQGGLLYGQITADYDLKTKELNTVNLNYDNIWKNHNLEIENRRYEKSREWGIEFYKDRSFYEDTGGEIVIAERVPLGSRAELIYMGTPIDIQEDVNGVVRFSNPLIRTDRTYILKVYEPDGKIKEREIKTVNDYFLQKKGQIEYRVSINERKQYDKFETDAKFFYGISDKLTFGLGYGRKLEEILSEDIKYINDLSADIVYGGTYNGLSYTLNLSGEKTVDNLKTKISRNNREEIISMRNRYKYKYLNQFNYKKWKVIYEYENYGKFYEEEKRDKIELRYDIFKHLNLGYDWEKIKYRDKDSEIQNNLITINSDFSWNKFLFSVGISQNMENEDENEYRGSIYYNGWQSLTARLENVWIKSGKEYETRLSLYNNNFKGFLDFSSELSYSNKNKEKLTFSITIKLDDWLKIDNVLKDDGSRNHRIGIDKVIDLKNPMKKIDSMDSSRVKVITFLDENNNNKYDVGEGRVEGVEVRSGNDKIITDKNGEGMFYGIGNGNTYELKTTIKKPSFTIGDNILKVKSSFSSTVEAYIPIKPMLTLSGSVVLEKDFKLQEDEKEEFFSNLIVELKDLDGKVIEAAIPDNEGYFDISGLFPKDYYLEVTYVGDRYDLKNIKEQIELIYDQNSSVNGVLLKISNKEIAIKMTGNKFVKLES